MDLKRKRQRFNIILHYAHLREAKPHILDSYGVNSTADLTEKQLDDAIKRVSDIAGQKEHDTDKDIRHWRHICLRKISECGVDTDDWNNVNRFMLDKRVCGKHLYELSLDELKVLQRKLQNIAKNIKERDDRIQNIIIQN